MVVGLDEFGLLILPRCLRLGGDGDGDDDFHNDCYGSFDNGGLQCP